MITVAVLVGCVFLLVFVLELLNAFYDAMLRGQVSAGVGKPSNLLTWLLSVIRALVVNVMVFSMVVALWFHELSHAFVQLLGGGMPRVVMCTGGGYAQSRPWPLGALGTYVWLLGRVVLRGFMSLAPLVVGSGLVLLALWFGSPLGASGDFDVLVHGLVQAATGTAAAELPRAGLEGASMYVHHWAAAGLVGSVGVFLLALAIASSMTPSSVDFINSRWVLPAYGVAVVAAAATYGALPGAPLALMGAGGGLVVFWFMLSARLSWKADWPWFFGSLGAWLAILGGLGFTPILRTSPVQTIAYGTGALLALLVLACTIYLAFLVFMVGLSLLALNPRPLWHGLIAVPGELKRVFTPIVICHEKQMMFQDRCDYCQCSRSDFNADGCGAKSKGKRKGSFFHRLRKNLNR